MREIYDDWKGHYVWHVDYGDKKETFYGFILTLYRTGIISNYHFNYVNRSYAVVWIS